MEKGEIIKGLYAGILDLDKPKAVKMAQAIINLQLDISEIIEKAMSPAMDEVGKRFQTGECYVPELLIAAGVFTAAMDILQPKLLELRTDLKTEGRVVIGTVKGDLHAIGKNLVATMFRVGGFEVHDLGVDVPTFTFLEQAAKVRANIIALSALLTTTMPMQREVIQALKQEGIRSNFKVMIGGAPVNQEWANEIDADGYGSDAAEAVKIARKLCA